MRVRACVTLQNRQPQINNNKRKQQHQPGKETDIRFIQNWHSYLARERVATKKAKNIVVQNYFLSFLVVTTVVTTSCFSLPLLFRHGLVCISPLFIGPSLLILKGSFRSTFVVLF
jgi:hypothetical protein